MHGDYYLPDLKINEEEPTYGKYGIMRKQFLKEMCIRDSNGVSFEDAFEELLLSV